MNDYLQAVKQSEKAANLAQLALGDLILKCPISFKTVEIFKAA